MRVLIALALLSGVLAFGQSAEPTKREIADAYRSKVSQGGTAFGLRWEKWRVKEIRGWSLKFKRLHEDRGGAVLIRRYLAVARKNGTCAEYGILDSIPLAPVSSTVKPTLSVEPTGVKACK